MAYSAGSSSPQTPLQQLLEDLHFLRAKDRRQHAQRGAASDDPTGGFAPTPTSQSNTHWTDLFIRHFLFQSDIPLAAASRTASQQQLANAANRYGGSSGNISTGLSGSTASLSSACGADDEADDLLFFVRKKQARGAGRRGGGGGATAGTASGRFVAEVSVCRKDSRKLPIGDPDVDWQETVYLNLIIHQFVYTLTLAICTRTSPKELQVLRRHSQRVYASPSRRQMDGKGEREEYTYPQVCFMVDNFDEVFGDMQARDGEMVCVELVASERGSPVTGADAALVQSVLFLGSMRYDGLRRVYETRQSASLSARMVQRMRFGLFGAGDGPRCEFVRMNGPRGKGHAEMAVTKPKGSGVETPTSEPGYCATDMLWDDDDNEQDVGDEDERTGWSESEEADTAEATRPYRRRLMSDPSASLQHFSRFSWRSGNRQQQQQQQSKQSPSAAMDFHSAKTRSQSEGLDSVGNELGEIEAGDLTDELDDGAYNPLWTSRGCTQTFHFWKEHRRQQSTPLNAFCTYVSLPWWTIARDLLGSRDRPILTF